MGDMLSKPVTEKYTGFLEDTRVRVAYTSMQGWRRGMEDAHAAILRLSPSTSDDCSFFGVYDGHCGAKVAQYAGERLPSLLASLPEFSRKDFPAALRKAYLQLDEQIAQHDVLRTDGSGCTAVSILMTEGIIYCANAGDSRAVLCRGGQAIPLSYDHKPTLQGELRRIEKAGCFVSSNRVNGNLALSRAFGDLDFKKNLSLPLEEQAITPLPDIITQSITQSDEFVIVACDGIWDVLENQQVVNFIRGHRRFADDLPAVLEELLDRCLAPYAPSVGCDNMTIIVIHLKEGYRSYLAQRRGSV